MNDSERFDKIEKQLKNLETDSKIHLAIVIFSFIGVLSLRSLIKDLKKI
jgi:hypothetical protein